MRDALATLERRWLMRAELQVIDCRVVAAACALHKIWMTIEGRGANLKGRPWLINFHHHALSLKPGQLGLNIPGCHRAVGFMLPAKLLHSELAAFSGARYHAGSSLR
jgi:hypothetical protein